VWSRLWYQRAFCCYPIVYKKDQREMFLTLPTNKIRFDWLTKMYNKFEK
jgi:hypothetical protein